MFKKLHFKIELLVSHLKKIYIYLLLGIALGSGIFLSRNYLLQIYNSPVFKTKIIGIQGLYTSQNLPEEITSLISYGLTINSENDKPILSPLVKSLDIQNDNKNYIFNLSSNIFWHNGKNFTASDINYKINGAKITVKSSQQILISLDNPFSPLLSVLSQPLFKKNLVLIGIGPYKVNGISYQDGYIKSMNLKPLERNKEKLIYRFYPSEKDLITAYKLGEVDEIRINSLPEELSKWPKTSIDQKIETNQKYSAIFLNNEKFNNKQLRQTLAYATPKTKDKNERCLGPISANSWAYNPTIKNYDYNPQHAKELFEKNKITKINLSVNDRNLLPIAENIKNEWKNILGIETTITIENEIDTQNFEAILAYGEIPHDPDQYAFWHSTQTKTNLTKLNNSRIDKLLEEGRQTIDNQERKKIYQDFQRYLLEESPAIFLSYPTVYTITRIK